MPQSAQTAPLALAIDLFSKHYRNLLQLPCDAPVQCNKALSHHRGIMSSVQLSYTLEMLGATSAMPLLSTDLLTNDNMLRAWKNEVSYLQEL